MPLFLIVEVLDLGKITFFLLLSDVDICCRCLGLISIFVHVENLGFGSFLGGRRRPGEGKIAVSH